MFKSVKKSILIILAFIALILTSEGLYSLRNNPEVQLYFYLNLTNFFVKSSKLEISLNYLGKAAKIKIEQVSEKYPQMEFIKELATPPLPDNEKLINEYEKFLDDLDYKRLSNSYDALGYIYYHLGLLAYNQGESDLTIAFWQNASRISPEWSYFHIELANYYLNGGQVDKANRQLEYCLQFQYPKSFCQWYIDNHLEMGKPDTVGFLEGKINDEI